MPWEWATRLAGKRLRRPKTSYLVKAWRNGTESTKLVKAMSTTEALKASGVLTQGARVSVLTLARF